MWHISRKLNIDLFSPNYLFLYMMHEFLSNIHKDILTIKYFVFIRPLAEGSFIF